MATPTSETFRRDDNLAAVAAAYCLDCLDVAKANFNTELDGSEASIALVEQMLAQLHDQLSIAKPTEEQIGAFAKMFGSYVGEVFRLKHGAEWGIVRVGDKEFPGMQSSASGTQFWPWEAPTTASPMARRTTCGTTTWRFRTSRRRERRYLNPCAAAGCSGAAHPR